MILTICLGYGCFRAGHMVMDGPSGDVSSPISVHQTHIPFPRSSSAPHIFSFPINQHVVDSKLQCLATETDRSRVHVSGGPLQAEPVSTCGCLPRLGHELESYKDKVPAGRVSFPSVLADEPRLSPFCWCFSKCSSSMIILGNTTRSASSRPSMH